MAINNFGTNSAIIVVY